MRTVLGVLVLAFLPLAMVWDMFSDSFAAHAVFILSVCLFPFCMLVGIGLLRSFDKVAKFLGMTHG